MIGQPKEEIAGQIDKGQPIIIKNYNNN